MAATQQNPRCLYEILAVNRDSSPEQIRSAYKRLALQLHPDKVAAQSTAGDSTAADSTAAFQELRHAYEVLSDPKERAWYDSHRSQILFTKSPSPSSSSSSSLDLFSFFSKSAFSGYTDPVKGFFKVYGDLFSEIYSQELSSADTVDSAPLIGNLDSLYDQVTAFYGYWLKFSTVLDFAWVDEYDALAGSNRKARRVMEEENRKRRRKAKREYSVTVRSLAAFVKKRDKRVLDMQMKRSEEEERRRGEERERRRDEERRKKERAMLYEEPDWARNDHDESKLVWDEGVDDGRRKRERGDVEMHCVVCNKKFKSEMQWKNHERSKKHREKVADLRSAFDDEDEVLKDVGQEELGVSFDCEDDGSGEADKDGIFEAFRDDLGFQEEGDDDVNVNGDDDLHRNIWRDNTEDVIRESSGVSEVQNSNFGHLEEVSSSVEEVLEISKGDHVVGKTLNLKKQQVDGKGSAKKDTIQSKSSSKGKKQKAAAKAPNNSCETCGESFDSRNKLFSHLSKTGHAMLKSW